MNTTVTTGENVNVTTDAVAERLTKAYSQDEVTHYLVAAVCATIFTVRIDAFFRFNDLIPSLLPCAQQVIMLLIIFILRNKLKLIIQLFKEAGKAVSSMPLIILQPLWVRICPARFRRSIHQI